MAADAADYKKGARLRRRLCRRVVSPQGKRLTMICASLVLLQIMFAVHRFAQGATALRAEGDGGALRAQSFIIRLRRSRQHRVSILSAYLVHPFLLRGTSPQWEACHQRGNLPRPPGRLYVFIQTGAFYKCRGALQQPSRQRRVKLKPLKNLRPSGPSTLKPHRGLSLELFYRMPKTFSVFSNA